MSKKIDRSSVRKGDYLRKHEKPRRKKRLHKTDWLGEKMKALKNELFPNQCTINN